MPPKLDNDAFIRKSKIIHKNFYDYSMCEYDNSTSKVKIICPESFKKQIYNDDIKKRYCEENGINLKIIRYDQTILDEINDIKNNIKIYDNM